MAKSKGKLTGSIEGEAVFIPYLEKGVKVSREGVVTRNGIPLTVTTIKNRRCVRVSILGKNKSIAIAKLIILAYKGIRISLRNFNKLVAYYIDGDRTNLTPENVVYVPESPMESESYPGYFHIPAYTTYGVNAAGELRNLKTGARLKWVVHGNYLKVSVDDDFGNPSLLSKHRAMAMALERYPHQADSLTVDHKDENSFNNVLPNFQWLTSEKNSLKARTCLSNRRHLKRHIDVLNCVTYSVTTVRSASLGGKVAGMHWTSVERYLNMDEMRISGTNFMFRYSDEAEKKPWPKKEDIDLEANARRSGMTRPVIARYRFFNEHSEVPEYIIFESAGAAARYVSTCTSKISDCLSSGDPVPFKGFNFNWYFGDPLEDHDWPEWTKEELAAMAKVDKMFINLISLTHVTTGEHKLYCGWDAIKDEFGKGGARDAYQENRKYQSLWTIKVYKLPRTAEEWMSADWVTKRCEYVNCKEPLKPTTTT